MAMLWMVVVALVAACDCFPEVINDFEELFNSKARNVIKHHPVLEALLQGRIDKFQRPVDVRNWPRTLPHLGQVTGVAVNSRRQPIIFHRGPRVWDTSSFNASHHFQHAAEGPIAVSTVLTLDRATGAVVSDWGSNLFYMPHGIAVDAEDNIWLTDVALHQVLKFKPGETRPVLTLGERFQPGSGETRFCQPTAVAVASCGQVFVADGYCNNRVLRFSPQGLLLGLITPTTAPLSLQVPHGLALVESLDLLCIADRENKRIVCPRAGLVPDGDAEPVSFQDSEIGRVFGVAAGGGLVYAVSGPPSPELTPRGITLDPPSGRVMDIWEPYPDFRNPHGIAICPNGTTIYVTEIGPNKVWKFSVFGYDD